MLKNKGWLKKVVTKDLELYLSIVWGFFMSALTSVVISLISIGALKVIFWATSKLEINDVLINYLSSISNAISVSSGIAILVMLLIKQMRELYSKFKK